jgi:hypothetical protein
MAGSSDVKTARRAFETARWGVVVKQAGIRPE